MTVSSPWTLDEISLRFSDLQGEHLRLMKRGSLKVPESEAMNNSEDESQSALNQEELK